MAKNIKINANHKVKSDKNMKKLGWIFSYKYLTGNSYIMMVTMANKCKYCQRKNIANISKIWSATQSSTKRNQIWKIA